VTLGTGACECLTALTCVNHVGRRYLIIGGYLLMTLWSIELYSWVPYVSMTSIFAFILSFGLGPGGITNTLTAELFIQSSRPAAYMIGGTISWISFFTIGMLFPFIVSLLKCFFWEQQKIIKHDKCKLKGMHGVNFHVQIKKMKKVSKLEELKQILRLK
uniref:Uncharacterized protein n=1 Tax=Accipiter nisus TaxID=211598 RepID=A0A8B9MF54_9AVES